MAEHASSDFPAQHLIPHGQALGVEFVTRKPDGRVVCRLPWRADLIGHAAIGSIFSGAVWALLDQSMGLACMDAVGPTRAVATIDLRVDYLRPSRQGVALIAEVECTRTTRQVAFARGEVHHEAASGEPPLALAQGTFMIYERPPEWLGRRE
ncbi:MAG TPA: PaaI family thioesterase [Kiloniellales bacterium]|nr:PaaI family thioesterase [Kiloniellales bacterium]